MFWGMEGVCGRGVGHEGVGLKTGERSHPRGYRNLAVTAIAALLCNAVPLKCVVVQWLCSVISMALGTSTAWWGLG